MKIIYQPSGKAREYGEWAANFYNGCSNNCEYCYCKKGVLSHVWSTTPTLKAGLKNEAHALSVFKKELGKKIDEIRKSNLFFSFTTDPLPPSTQQLTVDATCYALSQGVNVYILTKCADMELLIDSVPEEKRRYVAIGFTLTGMDELEEGASTNKERMKAMRRMYQLGFRTFASIEPIIDPAKSISAITLSSDFCELYKIGVLSGKKDYTPKDIEEMFYFLKTFKDCRFYLKDSFLDYIKLNREDLQSKLFVNNDFDICRQPTVKEAILINPDLVLYYSILVINDIACSMMVDASALIRMDKNLNRFLIKKLLNNVDEQKWKYEQLVKKKIRLESYFFDDLCQYMMDAIMPDVKQIKGMVFDMFNGNINNPNLFTRMELARLFTGIACVQYDNIYKNLKRIGVNLADAFKLKTLLELIDKLYNELLKYYKFESVIHLSNDETEKLVGQISVKMSNPHLLQDCIHRSEMENLRQIEDE